MRPITAVITTSILFGAFHMSVIRFFPTMLLGLVLAALVLSSRSIVPAVIFHYMHNAISVMSAKLYWEVPGVLSEGTPVWWHLGLAALLFATALRLLHTGRKSVAKSSRSAGSPPADAHQKYQ